MYIPVFGKKSMKIFNIILISKYNLNLIFFKQLCEIALIFYINFSDIIIIKNSKKIITFAK